jgi:L-alanine-DL-glutamate epimerase-like enolase superfamily enzyme
MKVTAIDTKPVRIDLPRPIGSALGDIHCFGCLLIFVRTDEGIVGENLVFSLNNRHLALFDEMVRLLSGLIVGSDPVFSARFWADAWRQINFIGDKGVSIVGISAIDGALWDIRGKMSGLPISHLIGACRSEVPAYASGGLWLSSSIPELQAEARRYVERGFRAIKMRLGMPKIEQDVERVRAVRAAIGSDIELMADANQKFNASEAIRIGRLLEGMNLAWFEEPVAAHDHESSAAVALALDTPIASGETEYTRYGFRRMLELKSADILMPDLQRVGGVTEFLKVAALAEAYNVPVSSHLFSEMSLQLLGACSNATYLEHMPWFECLYCEELEVRAGMAVVPERPGWGFTFDPAEVRRLGQ